MAIARVSEVMCPRGVTGATSSAIDTTGATLLVGGLAGFQPTNPYTIEDSKGNTWTALTIQATGAAQEARTGLYYVANPTVGTNHTFSWAFAGYGNATMVFAAYSGATTTSPFDQQNGNATNANVSSIVTNSVTPTQDNELVIVMGGFSNNMNTGTGSIDGGFTIVAQREFGGSNVVGGLFAELIQTTATAANPTVTAPTSSGPMSAVIATFKAAAGGGSTASAFFAYSRNYMTAGAIT